MKTVAYLKSKNSDTLFSNARKYLKEGNIVDFEEELNKIGKRRLNLDNKLVLNQYLIRLLRTKNKFDEANRLVELSLGLSKNDSEIRMSFLIDKSYIYFENFEYDLGIKLLQEASNYAKKQTQKRQYLVVLHHLIMFHLKLKNFNETEKFIIEAEGLFSILPDELLKSNIRLLKGKFLKKVGHFDQAFELVLDQLAYYQSNGNNLFIARCYFELGDICLTTGSLIKSHNYFEQAHLLFFQTSNSYGLTNTKIKLALINIYNMHFEKASSLISEALLLQQSLNNEYYIGLLSIYLGIVNSHINHESANYYFLNGLGVFKELNLGICYDWGLYEYSKFISKFKPSEINYLKKSVHLKIFFNNFYVGFAYALINTSEGNIGKALIIIDEIREKKLTISEYTEITLLYCKLLVKKWIISKNSNLFSEVEAIITEFENFCSKNGIIKEQILITFIKGELYLENFSFTVAKENLLKAIELAGKNGFLLFKTEMTNTLLILNLKIQEYSLDQPNRTSAKDITKKNNNIILPILSPIKSTRTLAKSIQREKIISILKNEPLGIEQKNLSKLTKLSQATISRRIKELLEAKLVYKESFNSKTFIKLL